MKIGVVFPQTEIGADRGAVRSYADAVSELGYHHVLAYDHVLGADTRVHTGWTGPYDLQSTFHEPFVLVDFRTLALSPRQATRRLCSHGECIDQNGRHFGAEWPGSRAWQNSFAPESTA